VKFTVAAINVSLLMLVAGTSPLSRAEVAPEMDAYRGKTGRFECSAQETGSGKTFKAYVENEVAYDGHTFVERYYEVPSAERPQAWKAIFLMSYDEKARRWVRNGVDNAGQRNAASSSGWKGDTWTWEMDGANIPVTKKGPDAFTFAVDVKDQGKLKRVVEALCKRM
jgi:hypothetical protein